MRRLAAERERAEARRAREAARAAQALAARAVSTSTGGAFEALLFGLDEGGNSDSDHSGGVGGGVASDCD